MAGKFRIRTAKLEDAASIQQIYAPSITESAISFETNLPTVPEIEDRIKKILVQFPWLVCEENGIVVGYAYGGEHRVRAAYRWTTEVSVYVDSNHFGKGIGKALYLELFKVLKKQGYHIAVAGITLPNEASVAIHESLNFKYIGTFPELGYKMGKWHDVGWWSLELAPAKTDPTPPIPFLEL